jgi:hypothetical protein
VILAIPKGNEGCVDWHRWFAWRPVRVSADYVVWLAYVERARPRYYGEWIYRFTDAQLSRVRSPF